MYVEILAPDDWHIHFRDGEVLQDTVSATSRVFSRALAMPNLAPPLTHVDQVLAYRERILKAVPQNTNFLPYMTLYLTQNTTPAELEKAKTHSCILGAKLYPAGATTHSDAGPNAIRDLYPVFEVMQAQDLVLQIHGELAQGDVFFREQHFVEHVLKPIVQDFPKLRMVLEHISSRVAVDFVKNASANVAATVTVHHLWYNRARVLSGGIQPHYYCLPILKKRSDQKAIQEVVLTGHPRFFAGTDSAPHPQKAKESTCGCAGIYSAPYALPLYATWFESVGGLAYLENFMSRFGADFYHLPYNTHHVVLNKVPQRIPETVSLGSHMVVPMAYGETIPWSMAEI
jgi:dihydroorotase